MSHGDRISVVEIEMESFIAVCLLDFDDLARPVRINAVGVQGLVQRYIIGEVYVDQIRT